MTSAEKVVMRLQEFGIIEYLFFLPLKDCHFALGTLQYHVLFFRTCVKHYVVLNTDSTPPVILNSLVISPDYKPPEDLLPRSETQGLYTRCAAFQTSSFADQILVLY